jgi:hypothetical protein
VKKMIQEDQDDQAGGPKGGTGRLARVGVLGVTLSCALLACAHTHSAGDADPKAATPQAETAKAETAKAETAKAETPKAETASGADAAPARSGEAGAANAPNHREARLTSPAGEGAGEGLPLATSPAGLLKPHAVEDIQDRLETKGALPPDHRSGKLDGPTREALRKFQKDAGLPATGAPDDLTIQKLGLRPEDVFRASRADNTK